MRNKVAEALAESLKTHELLKEEQRIADQTLLVHPSKAELRKALVGRECFVMPAGMHEVWLKISQAEALYYRDQTDGEIEVDLDFEGCAYISYVH